MTPFVKKTNAQIKAMSDAEADDYMAARDKHLEELAEQRIKTSVTNELKAQFASEYETASVELKGAVDKLKKDNETLAGTIAGMKEVGKQKEAEDPYAVIKQEDIDKWHEDKTRSINLHFALKVAGTMLVSTHTSGNTNFNIHMEAGIASAPVPVPLMVRIADVRFVKNKGGGAAPNVGWMNKKNPDGNAAITAEGALKPLRDFELVGETQVFYEIAVRENVGKYMLRDVDEMKTLIETDIRDEINREAGEQYFSGSGVSEMKGVIEYASAYTDTSLNATVEDVNDLDAIIAMALQIELLSWKGQITAVVNPITYAKIYTFKGLKHRELVVVTERNGELYVNNIRIMKDVEIPAGYALIGDMLKSHIRIIDDIEIETGYGASTDDFNKNLVTVRGDMRALHFMKDVETSAIIYDSLATVKTAIGAA